MHYVLHVLVPDFIEVYDIPDVISVMLDPFDANKSVEPHKEQCYCVNQIALIESWELAAKEYGKRFSELKDEYNLLPQEARPSWSEYIKPFHVLRKQKEKEHPMYQKPNPECKKCHGIGEIIATDNPNARWEWYVIGGRWNGWLTKVENDSPDIQNNVVDVFIAKEKAIQGQCIPLAVLTPDGHWYDRYDYDDPEEIEEQNTKWSQKYLEILDRYPNTKVVVVDCYYAE
jgi:hypothetical protein